MLKRLAQFFGGCITVESRRKKDRRESKDVYVRIVHAGGREELYQNAVPASRLMEKYPGMCVALPEIFISPHKSLLSPAEELLPGQKYYMIPSTTARKLKRKHSNKQETKEDMSNGSTILNATRENSEESSSSSSSSKGKWSKGLRRRGIRTKKPFVPPLPRSKTLRGSDWEPSLTSIQETSL